MKETARQYRGRKGQPGSTRERKEGTVRQYPGKIGRDTFCSEVYTIILYCSLLSFWQKLKMHPCPTRLPCTKSKGGSNGFLCAASFNNPMRGTDKHYPHLTDGDSGSCSINHFCSWTVKTPPPSSELLPGTSSINYRARWYLQHQHRRKRLES